VRLFAGTAKFPTEKFCLGICCRPPTKTLGKTVARQQIDAPLTATPEQVIVRAATLAGREADEPHQPTRLGWEYQVKPRRLVWFRNVFNVVFARSPERSEGYRALQGEANLPVKM